jgi:hypothetical protein
MNAEQMREIQRQANGDPQRMVELVVDHHLANTYNGDVNAYVDALGRNVETMVDRGQRAGLGGVLPFLTELHARGADRNRMRPILVQIMEAMAAAPPPAKSMGARRRAKTGRRARARTTRRGRGRS